MTDDRYFNQVPVTPEYCLAVIRDQHRQVSRFDYCCDSEIDLTLDSTIDDWRNAMDLLPTRGLGRAMNEAWGIKLSDRQWREVLTPPRQKTLSGVAQLISQHAVRAELRPVPIFGTRCLPAAAFFGITDCLRAAGADVSRIAPSTELAEFTRRHLVAFLDGVSRFAPGALPDLTVELPDDDASNAIGCIAFALWLLSLGALLSGADAGPLAATALIVQLLGIVSSWSDSPQPLTSATFGELRTFRDMANCIANRAGLRT